MDSGITFWVWFVLVWWLAFGYILLWSAYFAQFLNQDVSILEQMCSSLNIGYHNPLRHKCYINSSHSVLVFSLPEFMSPNGQNFLIFGKLHLTPCFFRISLFLSYIIFSYPIVQKCSILSSKEAYVSIKRWLDKQNAVSMHNGEDWNRKDNLESSVGKWMTPRPQKQNKPDMQD